MKGFLKKKSFEKGALSYISGIFSTSKQRQELENLFNKIDINKDGKLSLEEFTLAFGQYFGDNFSKIQIKEMFKSIDTDNSKYIGFQEFITSALDAQQLMTIENLQQVFKLIDKDNSGTITINELKNASAFLKKGSEDFINLLIQSLQLNQDEQIQYEDFIKLLNQSIHYDKQTSSKSINTPNNDKEVGSPYIQNIKIQNKTNKYKIIEPNSVEDLSPSRFKFKNKDNPPQISIPKNKQQSITQIEDNSIFSTQLGSQQNTERNNIE